uniref:Uncharacterized protein n=1 Tax=viral metagenome TaxID=1070528 RepID=A0A6H1ZMR0_9ZZZZ
MKCGECKSWIAPEGDGVSLGAIWGECDKIKNNALIAIFAVSDVDDDTKIEIDVHPEFGCVLFEEKE